MTLDLPNGSRFTSGAFGEAIQRKVVDATMARYRPPHRRLLGNCLEDGLVFRWFLYNLLPTHNWDKNYSGPAPNNLLRQLQQIAKKDLVRTAHVTNRWTSEGLFLEFSAPGSSNPIPQRDEYRRNKGKLSSGWTPTQEPRVLAIQANSRESI